MISNKWEGNILKYYSNLHLYFSIKYNTSEEMSYNSGG